MNSVIKHIILLALLTLFTSCEEPAPVELISEVESETEIEIINEHADSFVFTGYDSTGVIDDVPNNISLVSLSGITNTIRNLTSFKGHGEAIFYDTSKPIVNSDDKIIGYETREFGEIKFGEDVAKVVAYRIKYLDRLGITDTLVGVKHIINYRTVLIPSNLEFPYDQVLPIEIKNKTGNSRTFQMRIPNIIIGDVKLTGTIERENLRLELSWNKATVGNDEVILGGINKNTKELIPLFRIKEQINNRFFIQNDLIRKIPFKDYSYLVFTFIRKIRQLPDTDNLGDIYFASQSIHNIWVEIK